MHFSTIDMCYYGHQRSLWGVKWIKLNVDKLLLHFFKSFFQISSSVIIMDMIVMH